MMAFLPLVSASSCRSGRMRRNASAVSKPPVRMTRSTRGSPISWSPRLALAELHELQHVPRHAGRPERLDHRGTGARGGARGLDDDGCAGGERRERRARGDRDGEVPRRRDGDEPRRHRDGAVDVVEVARALGVVVGEVDRLRHLGVGLVERLARLGGRDLHQLGATRLELDARAVQDRRALVARERSPSGVRGDRGLDGRLERRGVADGGGLDEVDADPRAAARARGCRRPMPGWRAATGRCRARCRSRPRRPAPAHPCGPARGAWRARRRRGRRPRRGSGRARARTATRRSRARTRPT